VRQTAEEISGLLNYSPAAKGQVIPLRGGDLAA
jgi:hypothetical protein